MDNEGYNIIACKTKEALYMLWKNDKKNKIVEPQYKNYAKLLTKVINKVKILFDKETVKTNCNNNKALWAFVRDKINMNSKNKCCSVGPVTRNGQLIENDKNLTEAFNKFFCSIGNVLASKINIPSQAETNNIPFNSKSIFMYPTNANELMKIIVNLKDRAGGVDNVSVKVIKKIACYTVESLEYVINLCISSAI